MESILEKVEEGREETLDLAEVMCPICLSVLVDPVAMPCKHVICLPCFNGTVSNACLACPLCRKRLGPWCRKASKDGTLVHGLLWEAIQRRFGEEVRKRELGLDDLGDTEELFPCLPNHQLAAKGEVALEFQAEVERVEMERQKEKEEEERKSQEVMARLVEEEEEQERERRHQREEEERQSEEILEKLRAEEEKERQEAQLRLTSREATSTPERRGGQVLKDITNSAKRKGDTPSVLELFGRTPRVKRPSQEQKHSKISETMKRSEEYEMFSDDFIKRQRLIENRLEAEKKDFEIAKNLENQTKLPLGSDIHSTSSVTTDPDFKVVHSDDTGGHQCSGPQCCAVPQILFAGTKWVGEPCGAGESQPAGSQITDSCFASESSPVIGESSIHTDLPKESSPVTGSSNSEETDLLQLLRDAAASTNLKLQQASKENLRDPNFLKEIKSISDALAMFSRPSTAAGKKNLGSGEDKEGGEGCKGVAGKSDAGKIQGPPSTIIQEPSSTKMQDPFSKKIQDPPSTEIQDPPSTKMQDPTCTKKQDLSPIKIQDPLPASPSDNILSTKRSPTTNTKSTLSLEPTQEKGDDKSSPHGHGRTNGEENEYSENELLELLQIKPGKKRRSSEVKRLPKPNPDITHSPDPPPKYYKIGEDFYHEKNSLDAVERGKTCKKDRKENIDNLLSPILSKGELLITGGTGNYQILQPESTEEKKNPRDCEARMLEAAKMRAKLKWTCNTCGKYLPNEKEAKDHMRMGELKFSGVKNKMKFSGRGKCVVVSERMYSEEEIHSRTGFGLVDGASKICGGASLGPEEGVGEAKIQGCASEGNTQDKKESSSTSKPGAVPAQITNLENCLKSNLSQSNTPQTNIVTNADNAKEKDLPAKLKSSPLPDVSDSKPGTCSPNFRSTMFGKKKERWVLTPPKRPPSSPSGPPFSPDGPPSSLGGPFSPWGDPPSLQGSRPPPQNGLPPTSPSLLQSCLTSLPSTESTLTTLSPVSSRTNSRAPKENDENSSVLKNGQCKLNLLLPRESQSPPNSSITPLSISLTPSLLSTSPSSSSSLHTKPSFYHLDKHDKQTPTTAPENREEVVTQQSEERVVAQPERSPSPLPGCSKDITAELSLDNIFEFELEERKRQEEEDAKLARRLQEESDAETRSRLLLDAQETNARPRFFLETTPTRQKAITPKPSPGPGKAKSCGGRHRNLACKKCKGCLAANCGRCANCRDMPRFGGRGTGKQRCIWRRCIFPIPGFCSACKKI